MKRNDIKALQQKTVSELEKMLADLNQQLAKTRLAKVARRPLPSKWTPATLSDDVARVRTVLTQKQLLAEEPTK